MIKKKQVVAIVSIALMCFLIGTTMARGGSPWDKVWDAIYGLESDVEVLESQVPQLYTQHVASLWKTEWQPYIYSDIHITLETPNANGSLMITFSAEFDLRDGPGYARVACIDEAGHWFISPSVLGPLTPGVDIPELHTLIFYHHDVAPETQYDVHIIMGVVDGGWLYTWYRTLTVQWYAD